MKNPITPAPSVDFAAPPKVNLSRNVSPMHAELHAANSARLRAMDQAKAMAGAMVKTPKAPKMPMPAAPSVKC